MYKNLEKILNEVYECENCTLLQHIIRQAFNRHEMFSAGRYSPCIDSAEYNGMEFSPIVWIIQDVIPREGLTVLAAKPKTGKTFFCYGLAIAMSTGGVYMDTKQVKAGVLYYDYETSERTRVERLNLLTSGGKIPSDVKFVKALHEVGTIGYGLEKHIEYMLNFYREDNIKLVIIDMLKNVKNPVAHGMSENAQDALDIAALSEFCKEYNIAMIVTTHLRKGTQNTTDDPFDQMLGTISLQGSADTIVLIEQMRNDFGEVSRTVMHVKGREVTDNHFVVSFQDGAWKKLGTVEELEAEEKEKEFYADPLVRTIQYICEDNERWKGSGKDIKDKANEAGIYELSSYSSQQIGNYLAAIKGEVKRRLNIFCHTQKNNGSSSEYFFQVLEVNPNREMPL